MPHLSIEYSPGLEGRADIGGLCRALHGAMIASGIFPLAGIRVLDARPPHTETGLAGRALQGTAPRLSPGLDPRSVASTICDAIRDGVTDLPSGAFPPAP